MYSRISETIWGDGLRAGLLCLALSACGEASVVGNGSEPDDGRAECAIGPEADWARDCLVERDGKLLTLRHTDGGFRRFRIVDDGHGLVPADGAEQAKVKIVGQGRIEVSVGGDRYRLPATIAKGQ